MYTKIKDFKSGITSLIYFECDMFFATKLGHGNAVQRCEDNEQKEKTFERIIYTFGYKEYIKYFLVLDFNFEESTVTVDGKTMKIENSMDFVYKKTRGNKVLAIDGIQGFYKHVVDCMKYDSAFCHYFLGVIERIFGTKATKIDRPTIS